MVPAQRTRTQLAARAALALLAVHATSGRAACLDSAVPEGERRNVTIDGRSVPLGIWSGAWPSARQYGEVLRIVLAEVLGMNVDFAESWLVESGVWALAGCAQGGVGAEPAEGCVLDEGRAASAWHIYFESWDYQIPPTMEALRLINAKRLPVNLGSVGYDGIEAVNLHSSILDSAIRDIGLGLDLYRSYNVSWHEPWRYFDTIDHLDLLSQTLAPAGYTRCTDYLFPSLLETYLTFFPWDTDGVETVDGVLRPKCRDGHWWISPACRHNHSLCIPYLTLSGQMSGPMLQRAAAFNMPIAVADLGFDDWYSMVRASRALFFWWEPDALFIDLMPKRVTFEPLNKDAQSAGLFTSDLAAIKLDKWVHVQLELANNTVFKTLKNMRITKQAMNEMLLTGAVSGESLYNLSCDFVRRNEAEVRSWLPDPRECLMGQGLNAEGTACEFCQAARYSVPHPTLDASRLCQPCDAGTYQETMGASACDTCEQGRFAPEGSETCPFCPRGTYSGAVQGACAACPSNMTTDSIASSSLSACVCDVGFYGDASGTETSMCQACPVGSTTSSTGSVSASDCRCSEGEYMPADLSACQRCKEGMSCAAGSSLLDWELRASQISGMWPTLLPGYMSFATEPLSVYDCLSTQACPGGDPGTCPASSSGIGCGECAPGYALNADGVCTRCSVVEASGFLFPIIPLLLGPPVVVLLYLAAQRKPLEKWGSSSQSFFNAAFVTFNYAQSVGMFGSFRIQWPKGLGQTWEGFSIAVKFQDRLRPACVGESSFQASFLLNMSIPMLVGAVFFLTWLGSKLFLQSRGMSPRIIFNCFGATMNMFSVAVAGLSLALFRCFQHPNGQSSLEIAREVLCGSDVWHSLLAVAGFGVAVYIVGAIAVTSTALVLAPKYFGKHSFRQQWMFLLIKFRPGAWWWGQVLILRGVLFNTVLAVVEDGLAQIWLTVVLFIAYVLGLVYTMPWRHSDVNFLDVACSLMFLTVVMMSTAFTQEEGSSGSNITGIMTTSITPLALLVLVLGMGARRAVDACRGEASTLTPLYEFRSIMRAFVHLPPVEIHAMAARLTDLDWQAIRAVRDIVLAEAFGKQPALGSIRLTATDGGAGTLGFFSSASGVPGAVMSADEVRTAGLTRGLLEKLGLPTHQRLLCSRQITRAQFEKILNEGDGTSNDDTKVETLFRLVNFGSGDTTSIQNILAVVRAFQYVSQEYESTGRCDCKSSERSFQL